MKSTQAELITNLTSKDDRSAYAFAEKIISESRESDRWYEYFDVFVSLLDHPKSLVRNRAINILAENIRWDDKNRFDPILPLFLSHITDAKPITARQCICALAMIGQVKPQYCPAILTALRGADLLQYKDSMRPLIEKDIQETEEILLLIS